MLERTENKESEKVVRPSEKSLVSRKLVPRHWKPFYGEISNKVNTELEETPFPSGGYIKQDQALQDCLKHPSGFSSENLGSGKSGKTSRAELKIETDAKVRDVAHKQTEKNSNKRKNIENNTKIKINMKTTKSICSKNYVNEKSEIGNANVLKNEFGEADILEDDFRDADILEDEFGDSNLDLANKNFPVLETEPVKTCNSILSKFEKCSISGNLISKEFRSAAQSKLFKNQLLEKLLFAKPFDNKINNKVSLSNDCHHARLKGLGDFDEEVLHATDEEVTRKNSVNLTGNKRAETFRSMKLRNVTIKQLSRQKVELFVDDQSKESKSSDNLLDEILLTFISDGNRLNLTGSDYTRILRQLNPASRRQLLTHAAKENSCKIFLILGMVVLLLALLFGHLFSVGYSATPEIPTTHLATTATKPSIASKSAFSTSINGTLRILQLPSKF